MQGHAGLNAEVKAWMPPLEKVSSGGTGFGLNEAKEVVGGFRWYIFTVRGAYK